MSNLSALRERVAAASEDDFDLFYDVGIALGAPGAYDIFLSNRAYVSAALALVEAKLPGWGWHVEKSCAGHCRAVIWNNKSLMSDWRVSAPTPALALLAALLAALDGDTPNV